MTNSSLGVEQPSKQRTNLGIRSSMKECGYCSVRTSTYSFWEVCSEPVSERSEIDPEALSVASPSNQRPVEECPFHNLGVLLQTLFALICDSDISATTFAVDGGVPVADDVTQKLTEAWTGMPSIIRFNRCTVASMSVFSCLVAHIDSAVVVGEASAVSRSQCRRQQPVCHRPLGT